MSGGKARLDVEFDAASHSKSSVKRLANSKSLLPGPAPGDDDDAATRKSAETSKNDGTEPEEKIVLKHIQKLDLQEVMNGVKRGVQLRTPRQIRVEEAGD